MTASSNFAIAVRIGTSRGAWGNLSSSMVRWMTAVTAASSASVKSIVGTARIPARRGRGQPLSAAGRAETGSNARTRTSQEHEPRALGDRRGASALAPTIAPPHDDATPPKWGCARPGVEASAAADPAAYRITRRRLGTWGDTRARAAQGAPLCPGRGASLPPVPSPEERAAEAITLTPPPPAAPLWHYDCIARDRGSGSPKAEQLLTRPGRLPSSRAFCAPRQRATCWCLIWVSASASAMESCERRSALTDLPPGVLKTTSLASTGGRHGPTCWILQARLSPRTMTAIADTDTEPRSFKPRGREAPLARGG